jgi:hypothetical protein
MPYPRHGSAGITGDIIAAYYWPWAKLVIAIIFTSSWALVWLSLRPLAASRGRRWRWTFPLLGSVAVLLWLASLIGPYYASGVPIDSAGVPDQRSLARQYILDGSVEPELLHGRGLFTDEELDALKVERDRQQPE